MSDSAHDPAGNAPRPSQDPWASLADELGISPTEPPRADAQPPRPTPPPKPKPVRPERPPAAARPETPQRAVGWDDLAAELGLAPDAQPRPTARPPAPEVAAAGDAERAIVRGESVRPEAGGRPADFVPPARSHQPAPRHEPPSPTPRGVDEPRREERDTFPPRDGRRSERPAARDTQPRGDDAFGSGLFTAGPSADVVAGESRASGAAPTGRDERRRRDEFPPAGHREASPPPDADFAADRDEAEGARDDGGEDAAGGDRPRRRRGRRGGRGRRGRERAPADRAVAPRDDEPMRDDLEGPATRPVAPDELWEGDAAPPVREVGGADEDDPAAPRRRRRGRRGGRGRSRGRAGDRSTEDTGAVREGTEGDEADAARRPRDGGRPQEADRDEADEPLPGGYGVRPAATRPGGDERAGGRTAEGDAGTRSRRRGRRRRSGTGSGRTGEAATGAETSRRGSGERRERRSSSEGRPDAGFSRRRRSDFAPVGSGREEDDEGLEFLGIDEAGGATPRREPRADDEVLVESGLSTVQDVPSWVEAIGIVIAGNLDARNRSPRGDDRRANR